jgi:hypothetical protein
MKAGFKKSEAEAKKVGRTAMNWVGGATAVIGLFASLAGGVSWLVNHHRAETERQAKLALADAQVKQEDYQSAVQTNADVLKATPLYRPALDQQLQATMLWVEDFHVAADDEQQAAHLAAQALDQIMPILTAGLTRSSGARAADVEAHVGWAHWLNQHIAEREFGPAAEQNLRAALTLDPSNVYANGMLGNWMLQNNRPVEEAMRYLNTAVSTGQVRPYVRSLELGGLRYLDEPGARAAQVKVANDMRKAGEPLDEEYKSRIVSFCFDPGVTHGAELTESLTAVPPDEAWQTYLWLNDNHDAVHDKNVDDFIHANLLEIAGKRQESLAIYRALEQELKNAPGSLKDAVDTAAKRLSRE